jgi:adenylylsulfate kinase-like enzyme
MMNAVEKKAVNELVLIRGLPGTGKSTRAKKMRDHLHLEADMFLMVDGVYVYDQSKVRAAHEQCLVGGGVNPRKCGAVLWS